MILTPILKRTGGSASKKAVHDLPEHGLALVLPDGDVERLLDGVLRRASHHAKRIGGTEGVDGSSQLVISGYVLPSLKVKYGVGIFDSRATLTLRYRVIPKLYIEAVSGVDQALDLLYAFEF